jgi:hypothetical protein
MKNLLKLLPVLALLACDENYPYRIGTFPEGQVTNLDQLNSEFDEMNSNYVSPYFTASLNFVFSSNATSNGQDFNLDARQLIFNQSKETFEITHSAASVLGQNHVMRNQLFEINTDCDERGPYSIASDIQNFHFMLYSQDCDGISQILLNEFESKSQFEGYRAENFQVRLLGQNSNEMYPSFYGEKFLKGADFVSQGNPEKLLFSSDLDGVFNIYEADIPSGKKGVEFLKDRAEKDIKKLSINTSSNDHMPFVYGDMLVFSSDRPGGLGGYDLYYSFKMGEGWSEPVNFGPSINSPQDEYRPVVSDHPEFSNRVMIFSSNRPGGLGGFDLYYVGVPRFYLRL